LKRKTFSKKIVFYKKDLEKYDIIHMVKTRHVRLSKYSKIKKIRKRPLGGKNERI